jgi:hypothetical protein
MGAHEDDEVAIRAHVEEQVGEAVVHAERAASEMVGPVRHDIWDVHCSGSRWWVVTNPTHAYEQADFKSRDVVLSFHIGLMMRVAYLNEQRVPVAPQPASLLPGSWRRWEQAFESYNGGDEAETFQAVGVRLRECLISFVGEATDESMVPEGATPPKSADVKRWTELLADRLAPGASAARLRSYLKKMSAETWDLVNWLTHAKSAVRLEAEMALKAVEHVLGFFTAASMRFDRHVRRCDDCGSYDVGAGVCAHCGWIDESYEAVHVAPLTEAELAERLAEPCTPSSDIATFIRPTDVGADTTT